MMFKGNKSSVAEFLFEVRKIFRNDVRMNIYSKHINCQMSDFSGNREQSLA